MSETENKQKVVEHLIEEAEALRCALRSVIEFSTGIPEAERPLNDLDGYHYWS
jgi:hypothetical protein